MVRQIKYAWVVFREKTFCMKTGGILLLQFFLLYMFCKPLILLSKEVSYPVNPFIYPFVMADLRYLFLFILGVVYYFSDIPFLQSEGMYQIVRLGRLNWSIGHILAVVFRAFFIVGINIVFCCLILLPYTEFGLEWGKLIHTVALTNIGEDYGFLFRIPYETISQYAPLQLTFLALWICAMTVSFMAFIMYTVSLYAGRVAAIVSVIIMDISLYILSNLHVTVRLSVAKYIPLSWMRIAELNVKVYNSFQLPTLQYIITVLHIGIVISITLALWKIRRIELHWKREDF